MYLHARERADLDHGDLVGGHLLLVRLPDRPEDDGRLADRHRERLCGRLGHLDRRVAAKGRHKALQEKTPVVVHLDLVAALLGALEADQLLVALDADAGADARHDLAADKVDRVPRGELAQSREKVRSVRLAAVRSLYKHLLLAILFRDLLEEVGDLQRVSKGKDT